MNSAAGTNPEVNFPVGTNIEVSSTVSINFQLPNLFPCKQAVFPCPSTYRPLLLSPPNNINVAAAAHCLEPGIAKEAAASAIYLAAKKLAQYDRHATSCFPLAANAEVSSAVIISDAISVTSKTPPNGLRPLPSTLGATDESQYVGRLVGRTRSLGFKLKILADWRGVHLVFSSRQLKQSHPSQ